MGWETGTALRHGFCAAWFVRSAPCPPLSFTGVRLVTLSRHTGTGILPAEGRADPSASA